MSKDPQKHPYWGVNEKEIQHYIYKALDSAIDHDVVKEHKVQVDDGAGYFIDVAIPYRNIAIECKKPRNELLKYGVGQCIRYEVDGWSSYLCSHSDVISSNDIKTCMRADIGLLGANEQRVSDGIGFDVFVQNRERLPITGSSYGYMKARDSISVNEILDVLEVNTMEDIMNLRKHLIKVRSELEPVRERRYKKDKNIEITLPEDDQ